MRGSANYLLLALLIVCGLSFWLGRGTDFREAAPPPPETASVPPADAVPLAGPLTGSAAGQVEEGVVHVTVLNGTTTAGLARRFGLALTLAGCVAAHVDNAPHPHYARTLLVNPSVLILDDSTASVDSETEKLIRQALDELIKGRTTFIITHRVALIKNADLILMFQDGELVEKGKHQQLMAKNGLYREAYETQLMIDQETELGQEEK